MKTEYNSKLIYVIAVVAATGGLLFGFDTGVISGAIPFFQKDFGIDNSMIEIITASGLCGAILGALFCGKITDTLGRKKVILVSLSFLPLRFMVRICSRCLSSDCFTFIFGCSYRSFFFCRTSLYCRNLSCKKTGSFGFDVSIDGYDRSIGFLSFRFIFCR